MKTEKGRTPLEVARRQGREGMRDTISYLKKLGKNRCNMVYLESN